MMGMDVVDSLELNSFWIEISICSQPVKSAVRQAAESVFLDFRRIR